MKCPTCGNDIGAQALFCGICGTPVVSEGSSAQDSLEAKSVSAQRRGRTARAAAEVTGAVSDTAPAKASFKGAMDTSHKKARRRMPVLILAALALSMGTTIAWAFYTIVSPMVANEREIEWTADGVYQALDPDRFDLEAQLEELAPERLPSVRISIPESIAAMEGDNPSFINQVDEDPMVIIYYRMPDGGIQSEVMNAAQAATR